ncbi:MAG: hypothetical protein ACYC6F_18990 [Longimicrobiales bacterium]
MGSATTGDQERQPPEERESPNVRFSVCAMTDLLGFASHLEISGYDLRTAIGEEAIQRLDNLEDALALVAAERASQSWAVPTGLTLQRINDSVICTMDLDDLLLPSIGQTTFRGTSASRLQEFFDLDMFDEPGAFVPVYEARLREALEPIHHFLGLVARLHLFIARRESEGLFPGARTVVSTGFRRPFGTADTATDTLSANFAFANVVSADRSLHGPHFFVDNNLISLSSRDRLSRNLLRFACFEWNEGTYDCLGDEPPGEGLHWTAATRISDLHLLTLFRRQYAFRRLNPSPLSFLQHLSLVRPRLSGASVERPSHPYLAHIVDAVRHGLSDDRVRSGRVPKSFLYGAANDLDCPIQEFAEILSSGDSPSRRYRHRRGAHEKSGHVELLENEEYVAALDTLDAEEVTIEAPQITPEEMGDMVWTLSEEALTGLLPFMGDDLSALRFPVEEDEDRRGCGDDG